MAFVDDVPTNTSDPHLGPVDHSINELSKETSLRVLEVPQIDSNKEVNVATVHYFRKWVVKPCMLLLQSSFLVQQFSLKLQILTCVMAKAASCVWEGKAIDKGVSSQLIFAH